MFASTPLDYRFKTVKRSNITVVPMITAVTCSISRLPTRDSDEYEGGYAMGEIDVQAGGEKEARGELLNK